MGLPCRHAPTRPCGSSARRGSGPTSTSQHAWPRRDHFKALSRALSRHSARTSRGIIRRAIHSPAPDDQDVVEMSQDWNEIGNQIDRRYSVGGQRATSARAPRGVRGSRAASRSAFPSTRSAAARSVQPAIGYSRPLSDRRAVPATLNTPEPAGSPSEARGRPGGAGARRRSGCGASGRCSLPSGRRAGRRT